MKFAFFSHGITNKAAEEFIRLIGKKPEETKIVYITTATNLKPKDPDWMLETLDQLNEIGFMVERFDLEKAHREGINLNIVFKEVDVVFFSGGNTFYLLYWIYKTGFDSILRSLLEKGVVYAGESAGVVCQIEDLTPVAWLDDPERTPSRVGNGLGYTDLIVIPHWKDLEYKVKLEEMKKYYEDKGLKVEVIEDNQAIFLNEDKITKIS